MNRRKFFKLLGIPALAVTCIKVFGLPKMESMRDIVWRVCKENTDAINRNLSDSLLDPNVSMETILRDEFGKRMAEIWIQEERKWFREIMYGNGKHVKLPYLTLRAKP